MKGLVTPWETLKASADSFMKEMYIPKHGYKLSRYAQPTLMTTAFAVNLKCLLGLEVFNYDRHFIEKSIDDNTGIFVDISLEKDDLPKEKLEYLRHQTNYFCRLAYKNLGNELPVIDIEDYFELRDFKKWLMAFDWDYPWDCSNNIMFVLDACFSGEDLNNITLGEELLSNLSAYQSSDTGLWGNERASLLSKVCGSVHFYPYYLVFGELLQKEKIKNNVNALFRNGWFYPIVGGGACPDYDGIASLCWLKANDVQSKINLVSIYNSIINSTTQDGLFCEAKRKNWDVPPESILPKVREWMVKDYHFYSGWNKMKYKIDEPNIWACFLRVTSLVLIENFFGIENNFHLPSRPGLIWYNQ